MKVNIRLFMVIVLLMSFFAMAFSPMIVRAQEGGGELSGWQLALVGIAASAALWILREVTKRGYQPSKEVVAIGLYVISFVMALFFMSSAFPTFPPFSDAPSFMGALLAYVGQLLEFASPVAGMAFLIYNIILKRVLESLVNVKE